MIAYMARIAWWKKALVVLSAMTVEEAFFRGFLQKRVGLIASTILFALAHAGYAQPMLLIGVTVISLIIGVTAFYRTKNLVPGMIAHGVFDAVQLFVIIPVAFRMPECRSYCSDTTTPSPSKRILKPARRRSRSSRSRATCRPSPAGSGCRSTPRARSTRSTADTRA
jgi:general stress protein CsbA